MNLTKEIWTRVDYENYLTWLKTLANPSYRDFHSKLTKTKYEILGIPVPETRKISKKILKGNAISFLKYCKEKYYEEVLIEGFVIAFLPEEQFFQYFEKYVSKIDNWAICDGFCNSIQIVKKNPQKYFDYFLNLLTKEEPFTIRVGLITLLSFYIQEEYFDQIFKQLDQIASEHYYVNMGMAWLLAEMYTKYPKKTEVYFQNNKLNDFTMNKTISKIRDSYRISKEEKEKLLKYKRKR